MKPLSRTLFLLGGAPLLLGSDCVVGRPIVDERGRYYPSDGVISCTGTRCADLPAFDLELPPPLDDSPCAQDLPMADLSAASVAEMSFMGGRHVFASERPLDVSLGTLELRDACVVLSGPVRVTFGTGSKLTNVTVMLGPANPSDRDGVPTQSARPTPNLYFGHAELDRVVLRATEEGAPSGSAQVEFSTCTQCETRIDSLNVTESHMQNSRLAAGSLTMVGGVFDTVDLAFEYGLLAGVLGNNIRTVTCNTLSLVGATITGRASRIGPCDCTLLPPAGAATDDAGQASDARERDASQASDAGEPSDAGELDAGAPPDAGAISDAGGLDAGASSDAGLYDATLDVSQFEASADDGAQLDSGRSDASEAAGDHSDATEPDAAELGAGELDAGEPDAGEANVACNGATISQSTFLGGMVDGTVHAENSTFRSVLFARHAPTSLDLWNVEIGLSVTCDHQVDVRLDKASEIGCTSCDAAETATACKLDEVPELIVNRCKSLRGKLPACKPPLPARRTPYVPMTTQPGQDKAGARPAP